VADSLTSGELVTRGPTRYQRIFKRPLDVALSGVLLIVLAPVFVAAGLGVLATLGRPVLHKQFRVGKDGHEFLMLKFCSMKPCRRISQQPFDGPDRRINHKSLDDPRHTRLGRLLRKTSIDELPQLWNVIRGDMSLVGPRPEMPTIYAAHGDIDRLSDQVLPGLTGPWQVYSRDYLDLQERLRLDSSYAECVTFRQDMMLLVLTLPALLQRPGT
jgi:lipopolysaccharide/colanic/teichoic acid biosynthesis glycosyltransferase